MNQGEMLEMLNGNAFVNANGIRVLPDGDGYMTRVELTEDHKNPYGTAHGGLIYTMADAVAGFAACKAAKKPVTLQSDFHFLKNVREGILTARAQILQAGGRVILLRVQVTTEDLLLAEGTFTYYDAGKKQEAGR